MNALYISGSFCEGCESSFVWCSVLIEPDDGQLSVVLAFVGQEVNECIIESQNFSVRILFWK